MRNPRKWKGKVSTRNWLDLPPEITENILHRLGAIEIIESSQKVCTTWRKICKDPAMWRIIDMWNLGNLHDMPHSLENMCRHAVDRSQGQLIDINIESFGTAELIDYIATRSSQVKRLKIASCYSFYGCLGKSAKKLESLEELSLNYTDISKKDIKIIGQSCPQLKSFSYNGEWFYDFLYISDSEAFAIAKSMPKLLHLQLIAHVMTDKGLKAILDGCDRLESLDLRLCNNLKLEGGLEKRCSEKIRDFKRPNDSLEGCVYGHVVGYGRDNYGPESVVPYHYGPPESDEYDEDDEYDSYDYDDADDEDDDDKSGDGDGDFDCNEIM